MVMDQYQIAIARSHTYRLLARLFQNGPTVDILPYLSELPELSDHLPNPFDPDQAAADFHQIFSYDIYPFEDIFRDPSGLIGGWRSSSLLDLYRESGFPISNSPSHISSELEFMAFLCAAEAQQRRAGTGDRLHRYTKIQSEMLTGHILQWVPAFSVAISLGTNAFYRNLGRITLELVADHGRNIQPPAYADPAPPIPDIWDDPQTTLKDIVHFLAAPPFCGIFIGRAAVTNLARAAGLPRGFGGREQMLLNLLRSAGQYDVIPVLLAEITNLAQRWHQAYQKQCGDYPQMDSLIQPWQSCTEELINGLGKLHQSALTAN